MNIENFIYKKINDSYFKFKTIDNFNFDPFIKNFIFSNIKIENMSQTLELLKIVQICLSHNLLVLEKDLNKIKEEVTFYFKLLKEFQLNPELIKVSLEKHVNEIFAVIYHQEKEYILVNDNQTTKIFKNGLTNPQKDLTKLITISKNNSESEFNFWNRINLNNDILTTISELFKIIG